MAYANMASLAMNHEDARGAAEWGERRSLRGSRDEGITIHALNSIGTMEFLTAGPSARATAERSLELAPRRQTAPTTCCARTRTWPGPPCATAPTRSPSATWTRRSPTRAIRSSTCGGSTCWATAPAPSSTAGAGRRRPRPRRSSSAGSARRRCRWSLALTVIGRLRARRGDPRPWAPLDEALALTEPELQRHRAGRGGARRGGVAGRRPRARRGRDRGGARARPALRGAVGDRRARLLAAARGRAGVDRRGRRRAVRARARRRLRAGRRALDGARAARTRRRSRSPAPTTSALLRRALDELRALGATAAAAVVARRLRERGAANLPRGPRAATRKNPAQLTARELEVLDAGRGRPAQPRHRRAPVPRAQDGRPPRLGDPAQARRARRAARRRRERSSSGSRTPVKIGSGAPATWVDRPM